ncbi:DUF1127 domain-containing protein [Phreatobacter stygius]|uniref:DUF1127 domain-containing protein n=1 Tax=Phreatobacter stygius TaxID=1940610 RepID=A0A4D7BA35_9HYPH|nr:DUF1127 domain-containing protein [Phreatobacter stygius]QCI67470.1 DUF1127 domain-containing protein [Phreatobacter stygius]
MNAACATEDLFHHHHETPAAKSRLLTLVLRVEAWFAARNSARTLYGLDDRALSDIGLSRADVERINIKATAVDPIPSV